MDQERNKYLYHYLLHILNLCLPCVCQRSSGTEEQCNGLQQLYGRYAAHRPPSTIGKVSVLHSNCPYH